MLPKAKSMEPATNSAPRAALKGVGNLVIIQSTLLVK